MQTPIAIIDGIRTPMCKSGGALATTTADDLGARVVSELIARTEIPVQLVDELIFGNVAQPSDAANIARVIALKAGLPESMPASTVQRNCGSGAEALTTAAMKIATGEAKVIIVGGVESMSHIPLLYSEDAKVWFERFMKARTLRDKSRVLAAFRPRMLKPVIGLMQGLTDPVSGLMMGSTAEVLARDFHITREEQDAYALQSHQRAVAARQRGWTAGEILPLPLAPAYQDVLLSDDGPRDNQSLAALGKLRPYFDRANGTVTVGNACPVTDGACALLVMHDSVAADLGMNPLGFLRDFAWAGVDPRRMGLGPVFATHRLLRKAGVEMRDLAAIELNEAFAAQVLACERAFASDTFAREHLGRDKALGELDMSRVNANGGAIALGHPVGMTGARLVLTLLRTLRGQRHALGLATMCIGGGQGGALLLEAA